MCSRSFRNANASASVCNEEEAKEEEEVLLDIVILYERIMTICELSEEKSSVVVFLLHGVL